VYVVDVLSLLSGLLVFVFTLFTHGLRRGLHSIAGGWECVFVAQNLVKRLKARFPAQVIDSAREIKLANVAGSPYAV
jgi:hypothetical protein